MVFGRISAPLATSQIKPAACGFGSSRSNTPNGSALCCAISPAGVDDRLETRIILQQALGRQAQIIIAKFRILKNELKELFIAEGEDVAILNAFDGLRPPTFRRD